MERLGLGARGRLPPLYTLNGRFGCHFLTQLALAFVTKDDELVSTSLEKIAGLQKFLHNLPFF